MAGRPDLGCAACCCEGIAHATTAAGCCEAARSAGQHVLCGVAPCNCWAEAELYGRAGPSCWKAKPAAFRALRCMCTPRSTGPAAARLALPRLLLAVAPRPAACEPACEGWAEKHAGAFGFGTWTGLWGRLLALGGGGGE